MQNEYPPSSYKTFGSKQPHLNSDSFLSLVGALSAIGGNAAGRFFWGSTSDKVGFKTCFSILTALQGLVMFNYGCAPAPSRTQQCSQTQPQAHSSSKNSARKGRRNRPTAR